MKHFWLNKKNNKSLILFFNGWSVDENPFTTMNCNDFDVLMFCDYSFLEIPSELLKEMGKYSEINLIAWSMGAFTAYFLKDKLPELKQKIAVNGTPFPIDNDFGIPVRNFEITLKNAHISLNGKFYKNMFISEVDCEKFMLTKPKRSLENQVHELVELKNIITNSKINYEKFFDFAIISSGDIIIPYKNQLNFWDGKVDFKIVESGHFPFYNWNSWEQILLCNQKIQI